MQTLHQAVASARGIVFDLFHTLTAREADRISVPFTYELLNISREAWEAQLFETSRYRLAGEERDPFQILARMARAIHPAIEDAAIRAALPSRLERFAEALTNIPASNLELLAALRRHHRRLGLISNADVIDIHNWRNSPLTGCFDCVTFSCEIGLVKPEPEIFWHCLNELGLKPRECLYVGDGGSKELSAARSLGFTTVMVAGIVRERWPDKVEPLAQDADFMIEDPIEMLPPAWALVPQGEPAGS